VYYLLSALFMKLFGISLGVGRTISAVAAIVTGVAIFLDSRRQTKDNLLPLVAMLFFFAIPVVYLWAPLMRVDALATAFSVAGLFFVRSEKRSGLALACICFILALYTKQNIISAPIAALLYLWLSRERKKAVYLLLGMLALGSFILILCALVWGGDFFRHAFLYNLNSPYGVNMLEQYSRIFREQFILIGMGIVYCIVIFCNRRADLAALYFLIAGISTLGFIKIGASINFFYEFAAACCLIITPAVSGFRQYAEKAKWAVIPVLIPLLLLTQAGLLYHRPHEKSEFIGTPHTRTDSTKEAIIDYLKTKEGPAIALYPDLVLFSGKEVYIDPFFYNLLASMGYWDESNFIRELENRRVSAIAVPFEIGVPETASFRNTFFAKYYFDASMKKAIMDNYRIGLLIGEYRIYIPRD
jgi:hypothetical protein